TSVVSGRRRDRKLCERSCSTDSDERGRCRREEVCMRERISDAGAARREAGTVHGVATSSDVDSTGRGEARGCGGEVRDAVDSEERARSGGADTDVAVAEDVEEGCVR